MAKYSSHGSTWRKWDLHIHSTASDGKSTPDEIIEKAKNANIGVIALTDHHTARNIDAIKAIGRREGIEVISGVEFRTEYGDKSVHLIGLFPDQFNKHQLDSKGLYELILVPLGFSEIQIIAKAREKNLSLSEEEAFKSGLCLLQKDFRTIANKIHEYGGIVSVHAGSKTNGLDQQVKHYGKADKNAHDLYDSLGTLKEELMKGNFIDVCEIRFEADSKEFYWDTFRKPSITASDAHSCDEIGTSSIWIKADRTFEGLKQSLKEPQNRIFFEDKPDVLIRAERNPELFIRDLIINKVDCKILRGKWFTNVPPIHFNMELVAIIGNKGHGKSAITDFIGLAGRSKNQSDFSFLNSKRFLALPDHKCFEVGLEYRDGSKSDLYNLDNKIENDVEKVTYLPQSYIEKICSDVGNEFEDKIKHLIFSYIPDEYRLNAKSYSDYIELGTQAVKIDEASLQAEIGEHIVSLLALEKKMIPAYKSQLDKAIEDIDKQLEILQEPEKKANPDIDELEQKEKSDLLGKIEKLQVDKKHIVDLITELSGKINEVTINSNKLQSLRKEGKLIDVKVTQLNDLYRELLSNYHMQLSDVLSFSFKSDTIETQIESCNKCVEKAQQEKEALRAVIEVYDQQITVLSNTISSKQKEYLEYLAKLEEYNGKKKRLIEDRTTYNNEMTYLANQLMQDIDAIKANLKSQSIKLYQLKLEKVAFEERGFTYIENRITEWQSVIPSIVEHSISFKSSVVTNTNTVSKILDEFISAGVKGSFCGKEEATRKLLEIFKPGKSIDLYEVETLIDNVIKALYYDSRTSDLQAIDDINSQFRKEDKSSKQELFYKYLYGCEFLTTITEIKSNNKSINELSPGEKGTVLLVLYLLLDKSTNPLIIDQPEENLDNQSVFLILRPFILEAKKKRQVIIVTHNPNIAVVCDAEQIICVRIDKSDNNQFSYESGSIENPIINKHVTDILEGTLEAFNNRKGKYANT